MVEPMPSSFSYPSHSSSSWWRTFTQSFHGLCVIHLLLLMAGDVELNPGPRQLPPVSHLELHAVAENVPHEYYRKLGLYLGLTEAKLSNLERDERRAEAAMYGALCSWWNDTPERETRQRLVEALTKSGLKHLADNVVQVSEELATLSDPDVTLQVGASYDDQTTDGFKGLEKDYDPYDAIDDEYCNEEDDDLDDYITSPRRSQRKYREVGSRADNDDDDGKSPEKQSHQFEAVYAELVTISSKLQKQNIALQEREKALERREKSLQSLEETLQTDHSSIRQAYKDFNKRWHKLEEEHKKQVKELGETIKERTKENKRQKDSFDTLKQANDGLRNQLDKVEEQNRKLESQAISLQSRLTNLLRKQELTSRQRDQESMAVKAKVESVKRHGRMEGSAQKSGVSKSTKIEIIKLSSLELKTSQSSHDLAVCLNAMPCLTSLVVVKETVLQSQFFSTFADLSQTNQDENCSTGTKMRSSLTLDDTTVDAWCKHGLSSIMPNLATFIFRCRRQVNMSTLKKMHLPELQELHIQAALAARDPRMKESSDFCKTLMASFPGLQRLGLTHISLGNEMSKVIIEQLRKHPSIQNISFIQCHTDDEMDALCRSERGISVSMEHGERPKM